ncbi:hypothetical protein ABIE76_002332 [Sinorhizobium fredii]
MASDSDRLPLLLRHGLDAAPPDLGKIAGRVDRHRGAGGNERRQFEAGEAQAIIGEEQDHQHRNALDDLDIAGRGDPDRLQLRGAGERHGKAEEAAADQRNHRQKERPLQRKKEEAELIEAEGLERHA